MSGRKTPSDDIGVPVDFLRKLLHSLEEELPRALQLRERLHMIPEPSHGEHATSGLVAEALGTGCGVRRPYGPPGTRRTQ